MLSRLVADLWLCLRAGVVARGGRYWMTREGAVSPDAAQRRSLECLAE